MLRCNSNFTSSTPPSNTAHLHPKTSKLLCSNFLKVTTLSKTGPIVGPCFSTFGSTPVNGLEDFWPMSRRYLEPMWFVGDPTSLARDNMP